MTGRHAARRGSRGSCWQHGCPGLGLPRRDTGRTRHRSRRPRRARGGGGWAAVSADPGRWSACGWAPAAVSESRSATAAAAAWVCRPPRAYAWLRRFRSPRAIRHLGVRVSATGDWVGTRSDATRPGRSAASDDRRSGREHGKSDQRRTQRDERESENGEPPNQTAAHTPCSKPCMSLRRHQTLSIDQVTHQSAARCAGVSTARRTLFALC